MQTVAIIDYGSGNLHSAAKALERAARDCPMETRIVVTARAEDIARADRIVLPGVGAFADCKAGLMAVPGLRATLERKVIDGATPFLGICVGMQLLATRGLEFTVTEGLGWIPGEVRTITPFNGNLKIPHMGWNTLTVPETSDASSSLQHPHPLLAGIVTGERGQHAYFVHSYHLVVDSTSTIGATTDYGGPITAFVARDTIAGTQFHPEKSQGLGLQLLSNFLSWRP
jgi:imidazole glycerol-phosphate synthase subunit HisH